MTDVKFNDLERIYLDLSDLIMRLELLNEKSTANSLSLSLDQIGAAITRERMKAEASGD